MVWPCILLSGNISTLLENIIFSGFVRVLRKNGTNYSWSIPHPIDFVKCWNYFFMAFTFDFTRIKYPPIYTVHSDKNHIAFFFYSCIDMQNVSAPLVLDLLDLIRCHHLNTLTVYQKIIR